MNQAECEKWYANNTWASPAIDGISVKSHNFRVICNLAAVMNKSPMAGIALAALYVMIIVPLRIAAQLTIAIVAALSRMM